ncbi:Hypothetical predicted protein, partial [Marmota monax]
MAWACLGVHPPLHVPLTMELRVTPNTIFCQVRAPFPGIRGQPSEVASSSCGSCRNQGGHSTEEER